MKILSDKGYTIRDIIRSGAFPWLHGVVERKQYREINKLIKADSLNGNILHAQSPTKTWGYKIKGKNIIRFVTIYGKGIALAQKKK